MGASTRAKLLTSRQGAERLGIHRSRLDALRREPTGPEWGRFEGAIRYDVDELDTWARQQKERLPTAEPTDGSTPPDG
jgi:hypothetical protein